MGDLMTKSDFKRKEGKYVEVNGIKMYYEEYGSGYPLILIHGGISSIQMWEKQISIFSKHFRVIAVDSRGHGKSTNPDGILKYKLMADDFAAFIKKLTLDKPLLCGWSDGGQIGLEIGMHYSALVKAIVLGGTMIHCTQEMIDGFKAAGIEGPGQVDFEKLEKTFGFFVKILKEQTKTHGDNYWKSLLLIITKMWFDPNEFPKEKVKDIQTPSLIILGDRDEYIPVSEAVTMYELMPNSELAIIPKGTHECYLTHKELFNQIVINYLLQQIK
jgi:pimeloyl-ACP methyl ester carboxylesterase